LLPEVGEGRGLGLGVDLDDLLRDGWEGEGEDQGEENEGRVAKSEHGTSVEKRMVADGEIVVLSCKNVVI